MNHPLPVEFDCAIVLGAKVQDDGSASPALRRRVAVAVALAHSGRVANVLMSGGAVNHPVPEARIMADLAQAAGLAPERIYQEDQSRDTIGNARHCRPIIAAHGWRRLLVVSDSYHLPRARLIFRHHGLAVSTLAARPDQIRPEWLIAHGREILATLKTLYRLHLARDRQS